MIILGLSSLNQTSGLLLVQKLLPKIPLLFTPIKKHNFQKENGICLLLKAEDTGVYLSLQSVGAACRKSLSLQNGCYGKGDYHLIVH